MNQRKLFFCGAWDLSPLISTPWQSAEATQHFFKLTGFQLRPFTFFKDGLHYQYFFADDVKKLEKYFKKLSPTRQVNYVDRVLADYNKQSRLVGNVLRQLQRQNVRRLTLKALLDSLDLLYRALSSVTMQIWFVLFLDQWFPKPKITLRFLPAAIKARDHSGHQHEPARPLKARYWQEVSRRLKIPRDNIFFLLPEEINCVAHGDRRTLRKIAQRKKLYVTANLGSGYQIFEGQKARALLRHFVTKETQHDMIHQLKGLPAYSGVVSGKVRKVLRHRDLGRFKRGEVLVALQTLVDFVPVMKKARAILTEFGGITSHAAVVSRELKIPCVVGIEHLTETLQNGNRVSVDAASGIIKRIKAA